MESPTPSGQSHFAASLPPGITSKTLYPGGTGEVDYDQTIKIKTPGTGMTVFGRYRLERVLGRGGMGVVWLADDQKLERPVALKFLPSLIGLDPAAVKELKTETRRGLELSHPHIVRIYDFVDDDDAAAISMEFVDGKTLSELRLSTATGVFSVDEISQWLLGVCDALDYAHFQRRLIHRDLKPANIMLTTKDSVAKIADFGIARSLSDTMSRLSAAHIGTSGTLPYMSPQQAMGERPQPTDDVYSLGATLYELLTGKPPFYRGDLPTQINSKIPPSVYERRQELEAQSKDVVPKVWEEALAACLQKEPTLRPSCAGALAEMLGLKPITVSARTGTYAVEAARSAASQSSANKVPLMAAAAAVVVGLGAAGWYFTQNPTEETDTTKPSPAVAAVTDSEKPAVTPTDKAEPAKGKEPESDTLAVTPPPVPATSTEPQPAAPAPAAAATTTPEPAAPSGTMPTAPAPASTPTVAGTEPTSPAPVSLPDDPAATPVATAPSLGGMVATAPTVTSPGTGLPGATLPVTTPTAPPTVAGAPTVGVTGQIPASPAPATAPAGGLSLTPDPTGATAGALANMPPGAPVTAPGTVGAPAPGTVGQPVPLPPGTVVPPGGLLLTQPSVPAPAGGFWTVEQIFPVPPHANYSSKGKRYLLYKTQSALKSKGLYGSTVDGEEGKNTHNAIVLFQVRSGLEPNGLLDLPTLAALQLSAEPDKADWSAPSSSGGSGSYRRRSSTQKEEPGFFQRTGDSFKKLFK